MIPAVTHWESYYVIVGSSAAALTGLQFVVITLIAESPRAPSSMRAVAAFGTPTVVHFCATLLVAAILSAPWSSLASVARATAAVGLAGLMYDAIVFRRARTQEEYRPEASDWIWHVALPIFAHAAILVAAILLQGAPSDSLFVVGAASLLLLFIGIHNAWDTVTYLAVVSPTRRADGEAAARASAGSPAGREPSAGPEREAPRG